MIAWNPEQYLRFGSERTRPSRDLASAVPLEAPGTILDAGCGPGNSTAVLKEFWPHARIQGVDASEEMLGAARRALPEAAFSRADLDGDLSALGSFDLVFSNAVLQWLADPGQGLSRLFALVKPGGALAVQVPACTPARSAEGRLETCDAHRLMADTAREAPFAAYTAGCTRLKTLEAPEAYRRLSPQARVTMWETRYCHLLDGYDGLLQWYRGTGMRPYLESLPDKESRALFEEWFLERAREEYPLATDGKLLFWFRRLFVVAVRR